MTIDEKERMLKTLLKARKAVDLACEEVAALFTDKAKWSIARSAARCAIDAAYNAAYSAREALDAAGFALDEEEATPDGEEKENEED